VKKEALMLRPIARVPALALLLTTPGIAGCYTGLDSEQSASSPTQPSSPTAPGDPSGDPSGEPTSGDPTAGDPTEGSEAEFDPAPARLRLLLARQYQSSVAYLLGDAAAAATSPPADSALNGFESIGAAQLALGDAAIDTYEKSALAAADAGLGDAKLADYLTCAPTGPGDAECHRQFVANFGRVAWRRTLKSEEVERYTAVAQNAALDLGDFNAGIKYAIAGMLQSPYFLYQVEVGEPDPNQPGERLLTGVELATRMSFFLLDTTPTREIIDLAESGGLDTAEEVRAVALTMVEAPAARAALGNFFSEVLRLRTLDSLPKDPVFYPAWTPGLGAAMRQETLMLLEDIAFERDADFRDFLDAPYTFANGPLAALYGLIDDPAQIGDAFQHFELPEDTKRGGILGQGGFLAAYAHISSTSPTLRGKFVREVLMCQGMPAPPPDVVTELPVGEYKTMRERLKAHLEDPACAGCHTLMDPIGLGLENFDGIGVFRLEENGVTLDTVSEIAGMGGFDGARELGTLLRDAPEVTRCMVRNLFRHATGHLETLGEVSVLEDLDAAFTADGFRMKQLLVELVASPAFLRVGTPE
jgi:hypothetical protein